LLRKLIELGDPKYASAAFILAVMLERKRLLKVKQQIRTGGGRVFIYEHSRTGDVFTIVDPDLHLDQLEVVRREVEDVLEHGLGSCAEPRTGLSAVPPTDGHPGSAEPGEAVPEQLVERDCLPL
jgi:hypothetical protein